MANLFLGFPVPRAKIAEMIEGKAPPKEHATWHEPDGDDPIVKPEDIGAGQVLQWTGAKFVGTEAGGAGITIPWKDVYINQVFESLDGYYVGEVTPGEVWIDENGLNIKIPEGEGGRGEVRKSSSPDCSYLTWNKERAIAAEIWLESTGDNVAELWLISGELEVAPHFGFNVLDGVLYGSAADGSNCSSVELLTIGTGPYKICYILMAKLIPGVKVEFYVNGEKKGELTTNLPSGTSNSNNLIYFMFERGPSVTLKRLRSTWWSFYQKI